MASLSILRYMHTPFIVLAIALWIYLSRDTGRKGLYVPRYLDPYLPPKKIPMNVSRCVSLHNEIARLGWEALGYDISDPTRIQTWFQVERPEAAERQFLSPDFAEFLEGAYMSVKGHEDDQYSFHWLVGGLLGPGEQGMFGSVLNMHEDPGVVRYLRVYFLNVNLVSHAEGLVFDMDTNTAILCPSIFDSNTVLNGRQKWYPLETILEYWLDMIKRGKVKAVGPDADADSAPWELESYGEIELDETIEVFNKLVEAIEARVPGANPNGPGDVEAEDIKTGLVDEEALASLNITPSSEYKFARKFIQRVRRPRFQFIAPGLEVPTPATFTDQPFFAPSTLDADSEPPVPSLLLFRSSYQAPSPNIPHAYHGWPWMDVASYTAGLYLNRFHTSYWSEKAENECTLVLPYGIGAKGYARLSDGSRFGENTEDADSVMNSEDRFANLYQAGHHPFMLDSGVNLRSILKSWLGMVESGHWKVNKDGVMGGITKWREADTAEHWEKYVIPFV